MKVKREIPFVIVCAWICFSWFMFVHFWSKVSIGGHDLGLNNNLLMTLTVFPTAKPLPLPYIYYETLNKPVTSIIQIKSLYRIKTSNLTVYVQPQ